MNFLLNFKLQGTNLSSQGTHWLKREDGDDDDVDDEV
jgi:hypothetical protein